MRIEALNCTNFLGLARVSIEFDKGLNLIAGFNGSGKSSVMDAIRFALNGSLPRQLRLKKDARQALTHGQKKGAVSIRVDSVTYSRDVVTTECSSSSPRPDPMLDLALDAQGFLALDANGRRKVLNALCGVVVNTETVRQALIDEQVPKDHIDEALTMLRAGFQAVEQYADGKATEFRGVWKGVTGEVYGDKKAEGWAPATAADTDAAAAGGDRVSLESEGIELNSRLEHLKDSLRQHEQAVSAATRAADIKRQLDEHTDKLRALVDEPEPEAPTGTIPCPACGTHLVATNICGDIVLARAQTGKPGAQSERDALTAKIERLRGQLDEIDIDRVAQKALGDTEQKAARDELNRIADRKIEIADAMRELDRAEARAESDRTAAERAAAAHENVQAWKRVSELMAPDGVQAAFLARALGPVNAELAHTATAAGWKPITVHADMSVTYGDTAYQLCSESEQWRVQAAIAKAIASLSGCGVLMLDRFDVLDLGSRGQTLDWLEYVSQEFETVIVAGTFKARPSIEGVNVIWMEHGGAQ